METETASGVVISCDEVFSVKVRAGLVRELGAAVLHRFDTAKDAEPPLTMHRYAYALIDARSAPLLAAEMLETILSLSPRLPVIVCLRPGDLRPPEKQLRALGAFEIVSSTKWPCEHLIAAINHAIWFASAANDGAGLAPTAGVAEPDRPLLAEVSHEMRSPLNSIIGFAESIEQQTLGPWPAESERYRDYARLIRNSGEHLLALFEDLLQIGDAAAFEIPADDRVNPAELARNVTAMVLPAAKQKGLTLTCEASDRMAPVQCNARFVSQALLNLLQNAVKFTNEGGNVRLILRQDGDTTFTVSDDGVGFAAASLTMPRNATSRRNPASGHGFGLRFVERVAAAHRGGLQIDSTPGAGSKIKLSLPGTPAQELKPPD